ncbi:hypothetical protein T492DRAFT_363642 [Pavlovales sp. CCMP2436]|nr:hypothetical protein T492DRAFT_363642 [Pavlovales sp. CCMP2436]
MSLSFFFSTSTAAFCSSQVLLIEIIRVTAEDFLFSISPAWYARGIKVMTTDHAAPPLPPSPPLLASDLMSNRKTGFNEGYELCLPPDDPTALIH